MSPETVGMWVGLALSLMIFSYVLGDNLLYRLAVYTFVGLAAGFVAVVTVESVLVPWFNATVVNPDTPLLLRGVGLLPLVLGVLLLLKMSARLGGVGALALAFLIAVGTAVSLVGAVSGTLVPVAGSTRVTAGSGQIELLNGFIVVIGVIASLVYFQYLARRLPNGDIRRALPVRVIGAVGQGFIVVTFGALYAGAILTSLTIFSERIAFILTRILGGA